MIGVVALKEALSQASAAKLDLVEISPNAEPPVCKLLDYGKFRYDSIKKQKDAKKKQRVTKIKEIKLRVNVGDHDYNVKLKQAHKFIEHGDRVKVTLRFRGREMAHKDLAEDLFARFKEDMSDISKVEMEAKLEGKQLVMVLA